MMSNHHSFTNQNRYRDSTQQHEQRNLFNMRPHTQGRTYSSSRETYEGNSLQPYKRYGSTGSFHFDRRTQYTQRSVPSPFDYSNKPLQHPDSSTSSRVHLPNIPYQRYDSTFPPRFNRREFNRNKPYGRLSKQNNVDDHSDRSRNTGSWKMSAKGKGKQPKTEEEAFVKEEQKSVDVKPDDEGYRREASAAYYDANSDDENVYETNKTDVFVPDSHLIEKHRYYPPNALELSNMFEGFVVYFSIAKHASKKNPFVVICESFRTSERFHCLDIEHGYLHTNTSIKFCTMRYQGMMLMRGVGETGNIKEPKVRAGMNLINNFAHYCYTLKMKEEYFSNKALKSILENKEIPGVYRVVTPEEAQDEHAAYKFIDTFFEDDSDCEIIFTLLNLISDVKMYARKKGYACRIIKDSGCVCIAVFKNRSPQYWRDKMVASGQTENEKYVLIPPQGPDNNFFMDCEIVDFIPSLKDITPKTDVSFDQREKLYGEKGEGPEIVKDLEMWPKTSKQGNKRRTRIRKKPTR